ncbi:MAG: class I SAM-dependent methyltransferase [Woeseiaceae bacterium]|nr:class I SAM-dependent methyltransferase [Woeseiaceae bacterium]MDX2608165.1 class I SAM-dependent methyltransferase [Woeseiaceae bacterium]
MGWYDDRILPKLVDLSCGTNSIHMQREKVVPLAAGDVLEIGFGGGLNLPYYDRDHVRKVWGLEPSAGMRKRARKLIATTDIDVELIDLPGEEIPLPDNSVDTVLVTYTLCTIADVSAALAGMRRALKPDGRLLFTEHGRAPDIGVRRWQDRLNPGWKKFAGGCNMNRDIAGTIEGAGFSLAEDNRMYIPGIRILNYHYWGTATPR